ncbi:DUF2249 domain-containing protein [Microbacterium horticulturae]|uniref:DUF2249 domain-containing protein n=1 Tax=Microbacterium horticulturae TaxID=3028316 RepID=A0ABY8C0E6_9MICO|nr:DUF2249 domain-containing protein [Microbacterium sp. KACC 23027]WEG08700.1 DUF2249 domain-containing protein [Microbacterium sp. KACC 23027]
MTDSQEQIVDARVRGEMSCADMAMGAFDALTDQASFVLVANHDPRGIHYMLQAERPGTSGWEDLESGPELWRARITRTATA